jgi:arginyl-tRNA synthetase
VIIGMGIQEAVRERLRSAVKKLFDLEVNEVSLEVPPKTEMGDLAFPVAFDLAKRLKAATGQKQNPREIATRLADELRGLAGVSRAEAAGAGYINLYLNRAEFLRSVAGAPDLSVPRVGGKIIVEHTSVNPNKAAHIGHLRNAVLGDTTVRLLRAAGEKVEVQNYIDNTGVQVADVVVGFKYLQQKTLDEIKAIEGRFDYYCWDLYALVGHFYEEDPARNEMRTRTLHELESGTGDTCEMADYIATRILRCHLDTMFRAGIKYDLLPRESDVLQLHIWERAFSLLKELGAVEFETEGKLSGCWVMRASDENANQNGETSEHQPDKVLVRSNGTVTYTGKDIAFHLWKLGQLEQLDFLYKPFHTYPDGHSVWVTTSDSAQHNPSHPDFGNGAAYFNVIDIGQSYPQHYVKLGVMAIDHDERVERSAHLAYEKVVLTPAAAEQLGQRLSDEDRQRTGITMSGRKGLGVKADDLIDQLEAGALAEVSSRHPDLTPIQHREIAHKIAIGALRYFLLKYSRTSIISFDFNEALAMVGETGVYIQNAVVRVNSIFRKLRENGIEPSERAADNVSPEETRELLSGADGDELWSLVYLASRLSDTLQSAVSTLEPAHLAKWTFQLAQTFNVFYEKYHILSEPNPARRAVLISVTSIVRRQLIAALDILGIEAPERM